MPTKRISDLPVPCSHLEHEPPRHRVFEPGVYEHTCPACGARQIFTVERPSWSDMPIGTRL